MINRELIQELLSQDLDAEVRLEVGGDGAIHSSQEVFVRSEPWNNLNIVLTSEKPWRSFGTGQERDH
jgi:hypothetical protein